MNDEAARRMVKLQQERAEAQMTDQEKAESRLVVLLVAASRGGWKFFDSFTADMTDQELSDLWMLTGEIAERLLKIRKAREATLP